MKAKGYFVPNSDTKAQILDYPTQFHIFLIIAAIDHHKCSFLSDCHILSDQIDQFKI